MANFQYDLHVSRNELLFPEKPGDNSIEPNYNDFRAKMLPDPNYSHCEYKSPGYNQINTSAYWLIIAGERPDVIGLQNSCS